MADEARATCAEGAAEGELFSACGCACEEKIREVDADDKEDHADCAPQDDERTAEFAADVVFEGEEAGGVFSFPFGVGGVAVEFREEKVCLGLRLRDGDCGLEAADECHGVSPVTDVVHDDGRVDVDSGAGREDGAEVEGVGQDANDGDGFVVEVDGLADDVWIGVKLALPEGMT